MSRIGKTPIVIPESVKITIEGDNLKVEGKHGTLSKNLPTNFEVTHTEKELTVSPKNNKRQTRMLYGLTRTLIQNMVTGVSEKFQKTLTMTGVGYKSSVSASQLTLNVGYSHPVLLSIPNDISVNVERNTKIIIEGISKEEVGLFASKIRSVRAPEPYKGKGIAYENEVIRRKAGKSSKK